MLRILLAGLAGAVVVFVWGMLVWMALPLHDQSVRRLPDEEAVAQALSEQELATGLYVLPSMPEHDADSSAEEAARVNEQWMERHREGPVASIFYKRRGGEPMSAGVLGAGLAIDFLAALIAAYLVSLCDGCRHYLPRVGVVALLGVFAALVTHVAYWNWMAFPLDHTIAMTVDVVIGWILAGLVVAAIVRPGKADRA